MKRYLSLLIAAAISAAPAFAAPAVKRDSGKALSNVLDRIDATASKLHTFSASFTQVDIDPVFDEITEYEGSFYFMSKTTPDNKKPIYMLRFDYMKPERSVTIINDTKIILFTPDMIKPQESYMVDNIKLEALFAGFMSTRSLLEHYDIFLADDTPTTVTLMLNPKTDAARENFKELRITFKKSTWLPVTVVQHKLNGQQITFSFDKMVSNRTVPEKIFSAESLKDLKLSRKKPEAKKPDAKKPADQ